MQTFVALLRGVNLGPTRKISMPQLRTLVEELGFSGVRTYINSGNVLLASDQDPGAIAEKITAAIGDTFGHSVDVVVRSAADLRRVLEANPFPDGDPSRVTVAFLATPVDAAAEPRLAAAAADHEPFVVTEHEIYVDYRHGIGTSRLAARFSAVIGVSATVRNLRTVAKLVDLSTD